jgi:serine-type D-Ala-D-Ala carboxypeptidase
VHSSGLAAFHPYYLNLRYVTLPERLSIFENLLKQEQLISDPGSTVCYSDIGFMLLCRVVEKITEKRIYDVLDEFIYQPLGFENLYYASSNRHVDNQNVAATELCPWRHILLKGQVHDDNAFLLGGYDGHAGLFGTAGDVAGLLKCLICDFNGASDRIIFESDLMKTFWTCQTNTGRALGFDMPSSNNTSSGKFFSQNSVGHLGYTGTSFWVNLEKSIIVVLLTNRVHPSRYNFKIREFRPLIHDEIMKSMNLSF